MAEKERIGLAQARSLKVNGVTMPAIVAGQATITGTGTVASGLNSIASVVATLGQDAALAGLNVTATWNGATITLSVWKPTSNANPTPIASTAAAVVNWIAVGG